MYHIQIVGAGYTGSRIAAYFREKKQKVWAVTRSGKRNAEFEALGITPVIADLTKPETLEKIPPAHFIVICPAPGEKKDEAAYRETYLEGIGNYLEAIRKNPKPNLIVYLSSTGVYRDRKGEWIDETTLPEPNTEKGEILLRAEEQILHSGFSAIIFRLAGIYGPNRNVIASPGGAKQSREIASSQPSAAPRNDIDKWLNHIHVDDIVNAMPVLFNKGEAGNVYLGVDDEPVLRSDFYSWLTTSLRGGRQADEATHELRDCFVAKNAPRNDVVNQGKRCSNKKFKTLGYVFRYPTFREGYEALRQSGDAAR